MKIIAVIPARIGSTRLKEKPLRLLGEKTIINHVYDRVKKCDIFDEVIVATDSDKIYNHVLSFKGKVMMTSSEHKSGTDRVAEVASKIDCDVVVNVQGDEPFIKCDMLKIAVKPFLEKNFKGISTLKTKIMKKEDENNPNIVKVVSDNDNNALYFSRAKIPFLRDNDIKVNFFKHIGLYVYDKETLLKITNMSPSFLEKVEKLEQLRALQNNIKIKVYEVEYNGIEINTKEDLKKANDFIKAQI